MATDDMILDDELATLSLTDENGVETVFEYLDCIEHEGKEYLVLVPQEDEEAGIVILEVVPVDEETENYISVSDEKILYTVYEIFKEKFKDVLEFAD